MRMLVSGREMEHADIMAAAGRAHEALVSGFMAVYPALRAQAPYKLNGLYEPEAWPEPDFVRSKFRMTYRYLPCPDGGQWDQWVDEMRALGQAELRERVSTALSDYVRRLRDGERLHDALVRDIQDAVGLARDYAGVADTGTVTAAQAMAGLETDIGALRDNKALRAQAAARAESILSVFGGAPL
jgi:hypothetical protein